MCISSIYLILISFSSILICKVYTACGFSVNQILLETWKFSHFFQVQVVDMKLLKKKKATRPTKHSKIWNGCWCPVNVAVFSQPFCQIFSGRKAAPMWSRWIFFCTPGIWLGVSPDSVCLIGGVRYSKLGGIKNIFEYFPRG